MNPYFSNLPVIQYNNSAMIDITSRVAILNQVAGNRYVFYPYQVKNGMRAEQVADKYYGDQDLVWLVYLSNNIVDPYYQWTMSEYTFNKYLIAKYGSIQAASSNIEYYRVNWYDDPTVISISQYNMLQPIEKKYWTPEYDQYGNPNAYARKAIDYKVVPKSTGESPIIGIEAKYWSKVTSLDIEQEDNTNKASIRLLDNALAPGAVSELKELLNR